MGACRAPSPLLPNHSNTSSATRPRGAVASRRSLLVLLSLPLVAHRSLAAVDAFDPVTAAERNASATLSRRVSEAVRMLDLARELQARAEFARALDYFTQAIPNAFLIEIQWIPNKSYKFLTKESKVIKDYKDFAFSDYARVGRALVLYEIGDREQSIAEMEDVSISLKGYPEVHAALAAALYADKHAPLLAENQFAIATLLDPHYTDLAYVRETKHWPPSLVSSLQHFITLS